MNREFFYKGVLWFVLSLLISNFNDVLTKYLSSTIPSFQIVFLRFLWSVLSLLPVMIFKGKFTFVTSRPMIHLSRGVLLFLAMLIWSVGLKYVPILTATLQTFTIPIFVLTMAPIFLKEQVCKELWISTIMAFIGIWIILNPSSESFHPASLVMLLAAFLFAVLDVINKKFIIKESIFSMMLYPALITCTLASVPAFIKWAPLSSHDQILLFLLGIGGNLILFCLLKSFQNIPASATAPYRYLEIVLSAIFGYIIFNEVPALSTYLGGSVVILSTLFIAWRQLR